MNLLQLAQESLLDYDMLLDDLKEKASNGTRDAPEMAALNQDLRVTALKRDGFRALIESIQNGAIKNIELS